MENNTVSVEDFEKEIMGMSIEKRRERILKDRIDHIRIGLERERSLWQGWREDIENRINELARLKYKALIHAAKNARDVLEVFCPHLCEIKSIEYFDYIKAIKDIDEVLGDIESEQKE